MRRNTRWAGTSFSPYGYVPQNSERLPGLATMGLRNLRNGIDVRAQSSTGNGYEDTNGGLMAGFATLMVELRECQGENLSVLGMFLVVKS